MSRQREETLILGRSDTNDYELMEKETHQKIFIEQKDKIQAILDKKIDAIKSIIS